MPRVQGNVPLHASYRTASQLGCHFPFSHNFTTTLHKGARMYSKIKTWTSACFTNILQATLKVGQ